MRLDMREILVCDSSFVWHSARRVEDPERYAQWDEGLLLRIKAALLAISVVTIAESRHGYLTAGWGARRGAQVERALQGFVQFPVEDREADAWARLRVSAKARGVAIADNDLWIAATSMVRRYPLLTCDRDHERIAPELGVEVVFLAPPV
jgi:predicted nucleic acid-binding protein